MSTKWYWVNHGRLTSERKAYTSHLHSSITRPSPAARALKHQAACLIHEQSTGSERVDAFGLRAVEVIICMITRDFSVISIDITGVSLSLSLSLPLTKVTHAQYRKRFRTSYNIYFFLGGGLCIFTQQPTADFSKKRRVQIFGGVLICCVLRCGPSPLLLVTNQSKRFVTKTCSHAAQK